MNWNEIPRRMTEEAKAAEAKIDAFRAEMAVYASDSLEKIRLRLEPALAKSTMTDELKEIVRSILTSDEFADMNVLVEEEASEPRPYQDGTTELAAYISESILRRLFHRMELQAKIDLKRSEAEVEAIRVFGENYLAELLSKDY